MKKQRESHKFGPVRASVLLGCAALLSWLCIGYPAQSSAGQNAKIFTAAQAMKGKALYADKCSVCHARDLSGKPSTPLKGTEFMEKWADKTVDDLYFIIRTQMPYGDGGSLSNQEYIDIVSFILQTNGYQPGTKALLPTSPVLKETKIGGPSAKPPAKTTDSEKKESHPVAPASGAGAKPNQAELISASSSSSNWLMSNHDYAGKRFVDLKQINRENAGSLKVAAKFDIGDRVPFHSNPVVYNGLMYVTAGSSTVALEADTLKLRWRHDWKRKGKQGWPMNRGVAIKDGMVVRGTHDGYLIALDAATGNVIWERAIVDMTQHEGGFTMAPVVFEDKIIIGPAGSELGVKGWVGAFRLSNGEQVWRFNTVPDEKEPGVESWGNADSRLKGGGAVWAPLSLDANAGVVYVPVANPAPDFYGDARPGNNLYTCSMIALDARSGKLKWSYQLVPHDEHDWDTTQVSPLFETKAGGKMRKLVAASGKDGLLHVLDRETHEHIYQVPVTTRLNTDVPLTTAGVRTCPGVLGGMQWNGPAFNPGTNMLYVPAVDWCATFKKAAENRYVEGSMYMGGTVDLDPPDKSRGWLTAIDASTGEIRWKYESKRPMLAAVTTTSADLIFAGELLGDFIVIDAKTGAVLYRFDTGGRLNGGVITYSVNGKQYVAVSSGSASPFWSVPGASSTVVLFSLP